MSGQSGGDGYGKVRKSCQTGGASGYAKHCGNTDDHKMSNRLERKLGKSEMDGEVPAPRMRMTRKRDKVLTRRHLMMKIDHLDAEIRRRDKDEYDHKQKCRGRGKASVCHCYMWDGHWSEWLREERAKVEREMVKLGYDAPPPAPGKYMGS